MLGKASIIGAVAAILITPTPVSAQVGGVVALASRSGGAVNPGATVRGAVGRGSPLGGRPVGKFTVITSVGLGAPTSAGEAAPRCELL